MKFTKIPTFSEKKDGEESLVHAIVETPRNTRHKYAFEPRFDAFMLKLVLAEGLEWPYDYGFIPHTLAPDGDPLDILILNAAPTFTGCLMECRILGLVRLDKDGIENDRVLAAPPRRPGIAQPSDVYNDIDDLPKEMAKGICRFLIEYSADEGHQIDFKGMKSRKKAFAAIEATRSAYDSNG